MGSRTSTHLTNQKRNCQITKENIVHELNEKVYFTLKMNSITRKYFFHFENE